MARQIFGKTMYAVIILLGVSLLVFSMMVLLPGDAVRAALASNRVSEDFVRSLREIYGLNAPAHERFLTWLKLAVQGDFGYSFSNRSTVAEAIGRGLPVTLLVGLVALVLEIIIATVVGVWSAYKKGSRVDWFLSSFAFLSVCTPSFLLVLAVQKWFVLDFGWFPLSGLTTAGSTGGFYDILRHIALPCMTLALLEAGRLSRYIRASMIEVLSSDYIRWSGANGVSPARLLWVHALKNSLLPFIAYLGMSLPVLFAGTVVIESMFGLPGIGQLSYRAVLARDYPLVLGITLLVSLAAVLGNMAADIACTIADPQTRRQGSGAHE